MLLALMVIFSVGGAILMVLYIPSLIIKMRPFFEWISNHTLIGYILYTLLVAAALPILFPSTLLLLAAAFSFSQAIGYWPSFVLTTLFSFVGELLGCTISFLVARYCCRKWLRKCLVNRYETLRALDAAFTEHGAKLVALFRMSFFIPFAAVNYGLGVTRVSLADYLLGTCVIVVNDCVLVIVGLGLKEFSSIFSRDYEGSTYYRIILIVGGILCVVLFIFITMITRQ